MIWIVLVQALTALSVFAYFRREHPSEQSWKTTVCAWIGFAGQLFVLALFYHYETFVAAGASLYVKELFTIGSSWYAVPVSWLGIIGVPCRWHRSGTPTRSGAEPREVRPHGPLRQRGGLDTHGCRGVAAPRQSPAR